MVRFLYEADLIGKVVREELGERRVIEAIEAIIDLRTADLSGTNLYRADLRGADLSGNVLTDANLSFTIMTDINLSFTDLSGATLYHTNLTDANLSFTKLTGVTLRISYLSLALHQNRRKRGSKLRRSRQFSHSCPRHQRSRYFSTYEGSRFSPCGSKKGPLWCS